MGGELQEPLLKPVGLGLIATMADSFDPLPELSDCDDRKIEIRSFRAGACEERPNTAVALCPLANLADHVRINEVHVSLCCRLARARSHCPCPRSACSPGRPQVASAAPRGGLLSGS